MRSPSTSLLKETNQHERTLPQLDKTHQTYLMGDGRRATEIDAEARGERGGTRVTGPIHHRIYTFPLPDVRTTNDQNHQSHLPGTASLVPLQLVFV